MSAQRLCGPIAGPSCRPAVPFTRHCRTYVVCAAQGAQKKGFDSKSTKKIDRPGSGSSSSSGRTAASDAAMAEGNWKFAAELSSFDSLPIKVTKAVIIGGAAFVLYSWDGRMYATEASSTAYKYPLSDAKVYAGPDGKSPLVESPLDGTVYDLRTGAVVKWCPKDSPLRNVLGVLKGGVESVPLKIFPTHVTKDGQIFIRVS